MKITTNRVRNSPMIVAGVLFAMAACPAYASDTADVDATIERWVAQINRGDFKVVDAACAAHTAVVDGFPPYAWQSCFDWMRD